MLELRTDSGVFTFKEMSEVDSSITLTVPSEFRTADLMAKPLTVFVVGGPRIPETRNLIGPAGTYLLVGSTKVTVSWSSESPVEKMHSSSSTTLLNSSSG